MRSAVIFTLLMCVVTSAQSAYAVCLDPETFISGYQLPFDEELESSTAVVVGKSTKYENVYEDISDPGGITAFIYTVEVLHQLKGNIPLTIRVRAEADSGRYPMSVGEQHVLFLRSEGSYFIVSNCGSSSQLPEGNNIVAQVESAVGSVENAP